MEDVGIFYEHLVNFTANWYILWTFGIICGILVYIFSPFWCVVPRKIWQPWWGRERVACAENQGFGLPSTVCCNFTVTCRDIRGPVFFTVDSKFAICLSVQTPAVNFFQESGSVISTGNPQKTRNTNAF
jgi:hypothetical protein